MNYKLKIRISIMLCFVLIAFSINPISVGAASIGEPVPTDVSYWGFDENTTSSVLNQGYNNILCLWDFENHEYLLVKCPDHMYYVPGGIGFIDGDYSGLFNKKDYQNYIRDQIIYSWGINKAYFDLSAMQYFTVYRVSSDGSILASEQSEFRGIVNGSAWNSSKTKYNALRWLYDHDVNTYNNCNYALIWATESIEYAFTGTGNAGVDFYNWASSVFFSDFSSTQISFTGGSTLNAAESDIPVYVFYPGGFNFTSPVAATPTPTPTPEASGPIPDTDLIDGSNLLFLFKVIDQNNIYANQYVGMEIANMNSWLANNGKIYLPYFSHYDGGWTCTVRNGITFYKISGSGSLYYFNRYGEDLPTSDSLETYIDRVSFNPMLNGSWGFSSSAISYGLEDGSSTLAAVNNQSLFEIVAFNHDYEENLVINYDTSVTIIPTPTPTSSPTPTPYTPAYVSPTPTVAPSPGVTITPTSGPSETSVKELHGWKGALQKVLTSVFIGNTDAIGNYFKDAVGGYDIVSNPFQQIVDSIYVEGSDQDNYDPFDNQMVDFVMDIHDQDGNILGGEHTTNWRLTILPKTFWEWLKSYSNYFEIVFYMVDASFLGATMKRWLTKQNDEGSESKDGD